MGFIAEEETAFSGIIMRQLLRTRRPFQAVVLDAGGNIVLKVKRPIKWFLNSKLSVFDVNDHLIGEIHQVWHLWRRRYDVFVAKKQFAHIDTGFWGWDFYFQGEYGNILAAINRYFAYVLEFLKKFLLVVVLACIDNVRKHRQFVGFAREIFTDTGEYYIRMEGVDGQSNRELTLDERAIILGAAINIDFDYFSRHSGSHGGMGLPLPFFGSENNDSTLPAQSSTNTQPTPSSGGGVGMPLPIIIPGVFGGTAPTSDGGNTPETQQAPYQTPLGSSSDNANNVPHNPNTQPQQQHQAPSSQWQDEQSPPDDNPFLTDEEVYGPNAGNDCGNWFDGDDWS